MFMELMKTQNHMHTNTMSFKHRKTKNTDVKTPKENVKSMQPNRQGHHLMEMTKNVFL